MNLCDGEDARRRTFRTKQNVNVLKSSLWLNVSRSEIQLLELAGSRVVPVSPLPKGIYPQQRQGQRLRTVMAMARAQGGAVVVEGWGCAWNSSVRGGWVCLVLGGDLQASLMTRGGWGEG